MGFVIDGEGTVVQVPGPLEGTRSLGMDTGYLCILSKRRFNARRSDSVGDTEPCQSTRQLFSENPSMRINNGFPAILELLLKQAGKDMGLPRARGRGGDEPADVAPP